MKFEITEVYSDGAVVKGSNGQEFGIGCVALQAVATGLRNVANGAAPVLTGNVTFTNGRPHPIAQMLGAVESTTGKAAAFNAGTVSPKEDVSVDMFVVLIENGEDTAVAYLPSDVLEAVFEEGRGSVATFSILREDAGEIADAIEALNHEGLPTQEEAYAAKGKDVE